LLKSNTNKTNPGEVEKSAKKDPIECKEPETSAMEHEPGSHGDIVDRSVVTEKSLKEEQPESIELNPASPLRTNSPEAPGEISTAVSDDCSRHDGSISIAVYDDCSRHDASESEEMPPKPNNFSGFNINPNGCFLHR